MNNLFDELDDNDDLINSFSVVDSAYTSLTQKESLVINKLLDDHTINEDQAKTVIEHKDSENKDAITLLIEFGFANQKIITEILSQNEEQDLISLSSINKNVNLIKRVPREQLITKAVIPIKIKNNNLIVAVYDKNDEEIQTLLYRFYPEVDDIIFKSASKSEIIEAIESAFIDSDTIDKILTQIKEEGLESIEKVADSNNHPIVRLVNSILEDAVSKRVSDIHIEPEETFVRIRYRLDGILIHFKSFDKDIWQNVLIRVKVMAGMNISDTRKAQDGNLSMHMFGRDVDFRVAIQPTISGENIVLRILDKKDGLIHLSDIGFSKRAYSEIVEALSVPHGIIISTGPTGSGKTTTLYSALQYINSSDINIMTLEDPVEYHIPLIRQTCVQRTGSITFETGLKSLMRQDPDVILIGEVRDKETANSAIRAAMTGHKVLTTLHTIDSISAIQRLIDIGISRYLISGNIVAIIAQRLVRSLCPKCSVQKKLTEEELKLVTPKNIKLSKIPQSIMHPKGCANCNYAGYKGRIAIAEVLKIDEIIDEMIVNDATRMEIKRKAIENGFITLQDDVRIKILTGETSIEEAIRVVGLD